ncbi:hypothetical protein ECZU34_46760 [Escherichia coli]|nr:hypothetical protein ECZU34_46760 [Escherichia coli]
MPDFRRRCPRRAHLLIYAIGSTAQCQFAQGDQIAFAKKMFNGAFRLPGNIDFTFFQPLTQIVRGKSTSTTSSAASKKGSGTVSRT